MAELGVRTIVLVMFATIATIDVAATVRPGYTERTLDDPTICRPTGHKAKTHELASNRNGSIVVRHNHLYRTWQHDCQFVIRARRGGSLIAAIQDMYLRSENSTCVDYVKFERKDGTTLELCGEIDRSRNVSRIISKASGNPDGGTDENTDVFGEFDPKGQIETYIHLSHQKLQPGERLDLTIVYTPYEDCRQIKTHHEDYREISLFGASICMWNEYFCDGYRNCVSVLCEDEEGCPAPKDVVSDGTGMKVTIGAFTTMLLCFIIFLMCVWICRKHKKLCWSPDCAGPSHHEERSPRGDREAAEVANPSVAVSPMLEVAVLPSVLDKDSPPSYESLFPEQANNPATT